MPSVRLPAFAKINVRLEVLGRRSDGYHELRTIFQTISLHDTLELETARGSRVQLTISGDAALAAESPRENLVYRAIEAARRELGWRGGVRARLTKRIPAGRGMGGGSSDAAVALMGMMRLARKSIPLERLRKIGSSLGADVPFFFHGGRALGIGRGDEIYPLPDLKRQTVLVVSPRDIAVPTAGAYRWLAARLTKRDMAPRIAAFCALCWSPREPALFNDFEPAVFARHPRLRKIKWALLHDGAAEASLAGSGSAVFALFRSPARARRTAKRFPRDQVFICDTISRGEYRRALRGASARDSVK
jgi:4-diphosphocytidyl-2-C-methyl-D-erythritol kinase